ncbi:hypothetical protein H5407_07910 [Mitsuaria sp. WAJ17]|uniref:hypothetical protein n=1 Tax=Mitsuaria sp. WAJ17 TaxID=2761452 RepID=UPI001602EDD8|nr:hypothetical protein [Mitsuaria sp. WAJ17]MBB2485155.1 hypothetical protein [Mitsuaria sp. WAJ17]
MDVKVKNTGGRWRNCWIVLQILALVSLCADKRYLTWGAWIESYYPLLEKIGSLPQVLDAVYAYFMLAPLFVCGLLWYLTRGVVLGDLIESNYRGGVVGKFDYLLKHLFFVFPVSVFLGWALWFGLGVRERLGLVGKGWLVQMIYINEYVFVVLAPLIVLLAAACIMNWLAVVAMLNKWIFARRK